VREWEFEVVLKGDIDEERISSLYAIINDGTAITTSGVSSVHFSREADSLEEVLRSAMADLQKVGLHASLIRMEPDQFPIYI
jgi:hypothetical protein